MNEHDIQYHLRFRQKDLQIESEKEHFIERVVRTIKERNRKPQKPRETI